MPASMIIALVGFMPNVSGRRSATPDVDPMPGSAPIIVPRKAPASASARFVGVSATENPSHRLVQISTSEAEQTDGQRNREPAHEEQPNDDWCENCSDHVGASMTGPEVCDCRSHEHAAGKHQSHDESESCRGCGKPHDRHNSDRCRTIRKHL